MDAIFHTPDFSPTCEKKYQDRLITQNFQKNGKFEGTRRKPILKDLKA